MRKIILVVATFITVAGIAFAGTVDKSTGKVNGTWENATINKRGTFTGSKK